MMKRYQTILAVGIITVIAFSIGKGFSQPNLRIQRYGMVIGIKPEIMEKYKRLHAKPWPGVVTMIQNCNIRNYSIYLIELKLLLMLRLLIWQLIV